jgi:hypothetical protein
MRGFLSLQSVLIPFSLLISLLIAYPMWQHRTLRETSPVFAVRAQVDRWAVGEERGRACLSNSTSLQIVSENGLDDTRGPFFAILRCNQPSIYTRLALAWLAPLVLMNLVLIWLRTHKR